MIITAASQFLYSLNGVEIEGWDPKVLERHIRYYPNFTTEVVSHEVYSCRNVGDLMMEIIHLYKTLTEQNTITAAIPFQGFYQSTINDYLDVELAEEGVEPPENWSVVHEHIAKRYCEYWQSETGLPVRFHKLVSPKEYNFSTDEIIVTIPESAVAVMRATLLVNDDFRDEMFEVCKSRSGFISFMPQDVDQWPSVWGDKEVTRALAWLEDRLFPEVEETVLEAMWANGEFQW